VPIPDHKITGFNSFKEVTGDPRQVAGVYFYSLLEPLVEIAHAVSRDFFARPHLYTDLGDDELLAVLARLNAKWGSDEQVPSGDQRRVIYEALFGPDGGDFVRLRDQLVDAASAFAERVFDTGEEMLRERVRTTHRPLRDYLTGVYSDSLKWSSEKALAEITESLAYRVLRSKGIAAIFGISLPATADWPYVQDSNGDKVVEEASRNFFASGHISSVTTRERFSDLQNVASRGAEALATIVEFDGPANNRDLDLLITKVYTWGSSLLCLRRVTPEIPAATPALAPAATEPAVASGEPW
jgi:hypothetical protein